MHIQTGLVLITSEKKYKDIKDDSKETCSPLEYTEETRLEAFRGTLKRAWNIQIALLPVL